MLSASMNNQVEVILLIQAQGLAHTTRLIWIFRNVHLPTIWTKQVLYPSSSSVQVVMMMVVVARDHTSRRRSAVDEGCRRGRHRDGH